MSSYPNVRPVCTANATDVRHGRSRRATSSDIGFTLVEVMIAMTIFLVASLGIAQLLTMTTRMHVHAQNTAEATRLAESKLEELGALDFATDPSIQITTADTLSQDVADYFDTPDTNVTRRWTVIAGPTATTRTITVRVIDGEGGTGERAVDLSSVLRQW